MECIVWDETPHPGYCLYSWDDDILLDYPAHGNYRAQPAPFCPGYDTVALAATELAAPRVAQRDPGTGTPPPIETVLDSGHGDTLWAAALSIARPPLPRVPRIAEAAAVNPRAPSPIPSTPSTVPMPTRPLTSHSRPISVRTDPYMGEELRVVDHPALFEVTPSAGTPFSVHPVHPRSLPKAEDVEFLCARSVRRVLFSIAALPKRFSTSPRCSSGGPARYSGKNARCRGATRSRSRKWVRSLR